MKREVILSLIRHGLTTIGTVLATHGKISGGDVETLVGALTTLAGFLLSYIDKKKRFLEPEQPTPQPQEKQ